MKGSKESKLSKATLSQQASTVTPLQRYEASLKAYRAYLESEKVKSHINTKDLVKAEHDAMRLERLILMEEAGQVKVDIKPAERDALYGLTAFQRRKAILAKCGVLNYLKPFYESGWNRPLDMSEKNLTLAVHPADSVSSALHKERREGGQAERRLVLHGAEPREPPVRVHQVRVAELRFVDKPRLPRLGQGELVLADAESGEAGPEEPQEVQVRNEAHEQVHGLVRTRQSQDPRPAHA
jgi:hypothetical protein